MYANGWFDWTKNHVAEWWHDVINLITNNTNGTPNLSQNELAFTIVMLFTLFATSAVLAIIMVKRHPLLLLDKSLLAREIFFAILFGVTLYAFYFHTVVSFYVRNAIYAGLLVSSLLILISGFRENTMSSEEVEEERQERLREFAERK